MHAANTAPSSEQWKAAPGSLLKPKLAPELLLGSLGPEVIVTLGPVVSTVQVKPTAAPVLPAASVAFTSKVWLPSATLP